MFRSPLKVYGEYLIPPADAEESMNGDNIVRAGGMSGLEIVVCAEEAFSMDAGETATIAVLHSQDAEIFVAMPPRTQAITPPEHDPEATAVSFKPGDIVARMSLPYDCLPYIKGKLEFSAPPSAKVSMFLSLLPR